MLGFSTNPRARIVERRGRVPDAAHHRAPHQGGAGAHLKRVVVQFLGTHHPGPTTTRSRVTATSCCRTWLLPQALISSKRWGSLVDCWIVGMLEGS